MAGRFFPASKTYLPLIPAASFPPIHATRQNDIFNPRYSAFPAKKDERDQLKPFWKDERHRKPTLDLYRDILRELKKVESTWVGSSEEGRRLEDGLMAFREPIRKRWRRNRSLTSPRMTREFLGAEYDLLEALRPIKSDKVSANGRGVTRTQELLRLLENRGVFLELDRKKRRKEKLDKRADRLPVKQDQHQNRPHLTGTPLRPTRFNPALPRLRPQPEKLSMMIHSRLRAYENACAKKESFEVWRQEMQEEARFLSSLGVNVEGSKMVNARGRKTKDPSNSWDPFIRDHLSYLNEIIGRYHQRAGSKYNLELWQRMQRALVKRRRWKWIVSMQKKARRERQGQRSQSLDQDKSKEATS